MNLTMRKIIFISYVFLQTCFASEISSNQNVIQLSAESADLNQQTHQGTYIGDVALDQGAMHLRAAKAVTKTDNNNQLIQAIAYGNASSLAHYWGLIDKTKPMVHAYAETITYDPILRVIELIGHARVEQGKNSFAAGRIRYDIDKQHVISTSDKQSRTTIIIYPETI